MTDTFIAGLPGFCRSVPQEAGAVNVGLLLLSRRLRNISDGFTAQISETEERETAGPAFYCRSDIMEADMKMGRLFAATVLGASLMAAGPAFSDPKHCPPGWAKKGKCSPEQIAREWRGDRDRDRDWDRDDDRDRDWDRRNRLEEARDRAYEDGYRDAMEDAWRVGDRVPRDRYRVVPDFDRFGWPNPRAGSSYVYADDRYYLIEQATGLVLDILTR